MRKLITLSALLLAACSQQSPQQAEAPAAPQPTPAQEAEQAAVAQGSGIDFKVAGLRRPLPEGVEFPFPYHRLNDNTAKADTPTPQRRVYVEIRQVTPQDAEAAFTSELIEHGFSTPQVNVVRGVQELSFSRADGVELMVKINPRLRKPKAPDATGTLHLVWQSN